VAKWYRKDAIMMRLPEVIADIKREARANGLTDDDIDARARGLAEREEL
jgi:hypothetical protein